MSEQQSVTAASENVAIMLFVNWYQQKQPTIQEASTQAYSIAHSAIGILTPDQVVLLLHEHPDWIYQRPAERDVCDRNGDVTIGDITRRHLIQHLIAVIQARGMQSAY